MVVNAQLPKCEHNRLSASNPERRLCIDLPVVASSNFAQVADSATGSSCSEAVSQTTQSFWPTSVKNIEMAREQFGDTSPEIVVLKVAELIAGEQQLQELKDIADGVSYPLEIVAK